MAHLAFIKGTWYAKFYIDGTRVSRALPEYRSERHARRLANEMEAREQFLANLPHFAHLAEMNYSATFMHQDFIGKSHVRVDKFRNWLREYGVNVLPDYKCRDFRRKATGKTYLYKGRHLTVPELMGHAKTQITTAGLRYRLNNGCSPESALTEPLASFSERGAKGAQRRWAK